MLESCTTAGAIKRSMEAERGSLPLLAIHGTAVFVHPWTLRQDGAIAEKRLLWYSYDVGLHGESPSLAQSYLKSKLCHKKPIHIMMMR